MANKPISTQIVQLSQFEADDLDQLCEATNQAILDGNGFGWITPPPRGVLESYWRGVLLVPGRVLFVARLEGAIVGTVQLLKPARNNESGAHRAEISTFFVAPWARGMGLARGLLAAVEDAARAAGFLQLELDVRASQGAAMQLYEEMGYQRWGIRPKYARINGELVDGHFYFKELRVKSRQSVADRPGLNPPTTP